MLLNGQNGSSVGKWERGGKGCCDTFLWNLKGAFALRLQQDNHCLMLAVDVEPHLHHWGATAGQEVLKTSVNMKPFCNVCTRLKVCSATWICSAGHMVVYRSKSDKIRLGVGSRRWLFFFDMDIVDSICMCIYTYRDRPRIAGKVRCSSVACPKNLRHSSDVCRRHDGPVFILTRIKLLTHLF